jgi:hypothetical protein
LFSYMNVENGQFVTRKKKIILILKKAVSEVIGYCFF